ncbi:MAG: hypothetical protein RIG82_05170 [Phycisphaeraceae bacterium]
MTRMFTGSLLAASLLAGTLATETSADPITTSFVSGIDPTFQKVAHSRVRGWSTGWEAATGQEVGVPGHPNASWNWSTATGPQEFIWDVADGVSSLTINGQSIIESGLVDGATDLFLQLRATDYNSFLGSLTATDLALIIDGQSTSLPDLSAASGWSGLLQVSGLGGAGIDFRLTGTLDGNFHQIKEERIKIDMKAYIDPNADTAVPSPGTLAIGALGATFLLLRRSL